jgi:hypothetical protein
MGLVAELKKLTPSGVDTAIVFTKFNEVRAQALDAVYTQGAMRDRRWQ